MNPSARIKRLQTNLKRDGFDPGVIDGIPGDNTNAAFNSWSAKADAMPCGADVSWCQPDIDFDHLVAGPYALDFLYTKAIDGTSKDKLFDKHWSESKRVGILRGPYVWLHPGKSLEAQADAVFNAVGVLQPGDLPVAIDVERDDKGGDNLIGTPDDIKATDAIVEKFANLIANRTGRRPLIYSYNDYLNSRSIEVPSCLLWIADYRPGPPDIAHGWSKYTFHQYAGDNGRHPAIKGPCDLNRFNGSREDLRHLAGL